MATHSSILAWEIPWTEEPGGTFASFLGPIFYPVYMKRQPFIHL